MIMPKVELDGITIEVPQGAKLRAAE